MIDAQLATWGISRRLLGGADGMMQVLACMGQGPRPHKRLISHTTTRAATRPTVGAARYLVTVDREREV